MKTILLSAVFACTASFAFADMKAQLGSGWDGKKIPAGQQCNLHGGKGATPPITVSGIPDGAVWVVAYFNDKSFQPLSRNGGHGTIAFPVKGSTTELSPVPGMTAKLPGGARVMAAAKSTGSYASPGYLPPCSGGRNNRYTVDLKAVSKDGKVLDQIKNFDIGKY